MGRLMLHFFNSREARGESVVSNKIELSGKALRNVVRSVLFLWAVSFGGGYFLGASGGSSQDEKEVVVEDFHAAGDLDDIAWLLGAISSEPTLVLPVPAKSLPVMLSSPVSPPSLEPDTTAPTPPLPPALPTVAVSSSVQAVVSDADLLTVCRNLPCKVYSEDWEWRGFAPSSKLITEKVSLTESTRAQCEGVLTSAAKTSRAAAKKLECFRTRHREAQCAQLHWNLREALPRDANGQFVIRSVVALNLLADFHLNGVKNPNQISLCIGDIREQYMQFVVAEAMAYQAAYEETPVRQAVLDDIFCAEQMEDITKLLKLDKSSHVQTLSGFQFPSFPEMARTHEVMTSICAPADAQAVSAVQ